MNERQDLLNLLEGNEIHSISFEGVVGVFDGRLWRDGIVIDRRPTVITLRRLFGELFAQEFDPCWAADLHDELGLA